MLHRLKKFVPKPLVNFYHYCLVIFANFWYRHPSGKLILIGVTGTAGKTTTCYLIAKILEGAGYKVGCISSAVLKVNQKEWLNDKMITMPGRLALQKLLSQMVKANCQYAVVETTSEGIKQFRHIGLNYDSLLFTNLYPEHLKAHGNFENYKKTKLKIFKQISKQKLKFLAGRKVPKKIIVNLDDINAKDFLDCQADKKFGFTIKNKVANEIETIYPDQFNINDQGLSFSIQGVSFSSNLLGQHNFYNLLAAIATANCQGIELDKIAKILSQNLVIPGRLELIDEGQNFKVIVDCAFDQAQMSELYRVVGGLNKNRIIHVIGGGGRFQELWHELGEVVGNKSDIVIVTNVDPFGRDPEFIAKQIFQAVESTGKISDQNLFKILDRTQAIQKAIQLANFNDLILITGKGGEQKLMIESHRGIPWDDRLVVRENLINFRDRG
ncbi:MAG: UDP-N-acetylmuramyl-tripeptide synthetase [Candidatus Buchananbacteria bacterium]|nr:UDP-N-acetylmuramyl-tripeptide synthetase [Candidatus Buchananbacteria bacterium]